MFKQNKQNPSKKLYYTLYFYLLYHLFTDTQNWEGVFILVCLFWATLLHMEEF